MATSTPSDPALIHQHSRTVHVLRVVAFTVVLPLLLFAFLSLLFEVVGRIIMPGLPETTSTGDGSLGFAVVATYVVCLPIFTVALFRYFRE